ncbi:ribonuclease E/G [Sphingomonas sp. NBWT7]|uniref:Rne/Rng family ribonuclease n=1 Tax=Sphingomonas sp. NBWT7 TaxID=2596913 RepID=UPI001629C561|nr:ribonuclease E/G [Sphingomonas sp. NBWT7]QNE33231.1 ribonuclease E/G [Sphingomonas sp. NBWT7]
MLIDARHREETRVAVVKGNRIEEFDFESAERKQLKGNIYLAKVTRVEPSLQAAFIDYGGNRHGFLAFSEIHPDYYQIPKEDREALLREEAEHAAEEAKLRAEQEAHEDDGDVEDAEHDVEDDADHGDDAADEGDGDAEGDAPRAPSSTGINDDQVEALRQRRMNLRRRYKIQDVIRRRQVLLVQVVKEERGNKGAALTTYLSLAGRYCVLMPNTSHGGGISRKISNASDRKRLKSIMAELALPPSMGCIVRTAGLSRTRTEIKRDFDYLARLWDGIRENTLSSAAPALIYGDSDLIKRAIRDIYNKDIDEVIVEGDEGYRQAREFMKLLMPSHAKRVRHYSDPIPLFQRSHVEDQLAAMYHPVVQLKSGGYLVINPTEALVSIDINSGRSTREHNIEQTATATNLEAAQEIARQLRLRDMAGLVVIDFIDMDNNSNVRKVEKAMKEALKNDRARIQVGRISSFGLMEMSRQRLRTGVLEASTRPCPHCEGTGLVRTASSAGLSALRLIEDEAARGRGSYLTLRASVEAAVYVLNRKRADIAEIEERYGVKVEILPDGEQEGARMAVEAAGPPPAYAPRFDPPVEEIDDDIPDEIEEEEDEEFVDTEETARTDEPRGGDESREGGRKRRRRRGRRGRNGAEGEATPSSNADLDEGADESLADESDADDDGDAIAAAAPGEEGASTGEGEGGRRRRNRRGRRNRRRDGEAGTQDVSEAQDAAVPDEAQPVETVAAAMQAPVEASIEPKDAAAPDAAEPEAPTPRTRRRPRAKAAAEPAVTADAPAESAPAVDAPMIETPGIEAIAPAAEEAPAKPKRTRRKKVDAIETAETPAGDAPAPAETAEAPAKPKRTRRKKADVPAVDVPSADLPVPQATETATLAPTQTDGAAPPDDAAEGSTDAGSTTGEQADTAPRRGWWQRTFGA